MESEISQKNYIKKNFKSKQRIFITNINYSGLKEILKKGKKHQQKIYIQIAKQFSKPNKPFKRNSKTFRSKNLKSL